MAHRGYRLCHYRSDRQHALCFSVKELPEEEFVDTTDKAEIEKDEKYGLVEAAKLLVSNNTT